MPRLKTFLNFYSEMAWYGVHVEGRYCGIADTIYGQPTRLASSGNWTHFRNADDWIPHMEEPLAPKKGKA
jgi:hypothetical protein